MKIRLFIERDGDLRVGDVIDTTGDPRPAAQVAIEMLTAQRGPGKRWVELYGRRGQVVSRVVTPSTGGIPRLEPATAGRSAMPDHLRKAARAADS